MLLNNECVIEEVREEFNERENTTYWNPWNTAKVVLRGNFVAMSVYTKNTQSFQINDLTLHLKILEIQEQAKPKTNRREIINI
jgi:hypothetical protein